MKLHFAKLHGAGNDFVMIDDRDETLNLTPEQVAFLCDRHFGIGADGVILVRPATTEGASGFMHYINADGTLAQMCGNGVRCTAKWIVDRGLVDRSAATTVIDTLSGPKPIEFACDEDATMRVATVDMGAPVLEPACVPTVLAATDTAENGCAFAGDVTLKSPFGDFRFTCVSMGNPHAVAFIEDWDALRDGAFTDPASKSLATLDVDKVGSFFESHAAFPEKANIEFVSVEADHLAMRVYERGVAETLACGTGACAVGVAAFITGRSGRVNEVKLLGGTLHIEYAEDGRVRMTGPAAQVFEGDIEL